MIIDFKTIQERALPQFKGGKKEFHAKMHVDQLNKIVHGRLMPGASIGLHTHDTNSEIIYILEGDGTVLYDGETEKVHGGMCHYCPKGHQHSLINTSDKDLVFFAVIPEHE